MDGNQSCNIINAIVGSAIFKSFNLFFPSFQESSHDISRDTPVFSAFRTVTPASSRPQSNLGSPPESRPPTALQSTRPLSHNGSRPPSSISRQYIHNPAPAPLVSNMPSTPIDNDNSSGNERPSFAIGTSKINPLFEESSTTTTTPAGFVDEYRGKLQFRFLTSN